MITCWTHIVADFIDCNFSKISQLKMEWIKEEISKLIKINWLTELGNFYHYFWEDAFTWVIALAESHISIHTWPELKYVTLDIYVCNVTKDHSDSAKNIFEWLKSLLLAKEIKIQVIKR